MAKDELSSFLGGGRNSDEEKSGGTDNLVLNLDDVSTDQPDFAPLPAGVYNAIVENTEFQTSKNGNPMISWTFRIIDPQYDGRFLFSHMVLNKEAGVRRLKRTLIRLGVETDLTQFNPVRFTEDGDAVSLPCRVRVRIRVWDGRRVNDVTDVLAPAEDAGSFLPGE
jgi:hypothetical protein